MGSVYQGVTSGLDTSGLDTSGLATLLDWLHFWIGDHPRTTFFTARRFLGKSLSRMDTVFTKPFEIHHAARNSTFHIG
jgi:hypothetical protein